MSAGFAMEIMDEDSIEGESALCEIMQALLMRFGVASKPLKLGRGVHRSISKARD